MKDRIDEQQIFPKQLPTDRYRNIICFAPHPDDEVQGCGGFFTLVAQSGGGVTVIILTNGDPTGVDMELQLIRKQESLSAAVFSGATIVFEGLNDRSLRSSAWLIARIAERIKAQNPDLVCIPSPTEMHPDHQATCTAALAAIRSSGYMGDVAFYEAGGVLNQVTHLVNIDQAIDAKNNALACFVSQERHQPYASRIRARDHFRALTLGSAVEAAEAFEIFSMSEKDQLKLYSHFQPWQANARGRAAYQREIAKVSVIVRSTGHPRVRNAIASILNQTLPPHEVLLVHALPASASTDLICALSPCIREIHSPHALSRPQAANVGLENVTGDYAIFLDEDDYFLPEHLESLVQAVEEQPTAAGALSHAILVDGNGNHIKTLDYGY